MFLISEKQAIVLNFDDPRYWIQEIEKKSYSFDDTNGNIISPPADIPPLQSSSYYVFLMNTETQVMFFTPLSTLEEVMQWPLYQTVPPYRLGIYVLNGKMVDLLINQNPQHYILEWNEIVSLGSLTQSDYIQLNSYESSSPVY